jgi:hypothetical protein
MFELSCLRKVLVVYATKQNISSLSFEMAILAL